MSSIAVGQVSGPTTPRLDDAGLADAGVSPTRPRSSSLGVANAALRCGAGAAEFETGVTPGVISARAEAACGETGSGLAATGGFSGCVLPTTAGFSAGALPTTVG